MPYESLLERDAFLLLEFSPGVTEYKAQPEKIYFQQDNKQRLYFPDIRIDLVNGDYLHIEVKPKSKLKNQILVQRLNAIHEHYKETEASGFMVFDESIIRREPLLTNLKLLAYHLPRKHIHEDIEGWLQKLIDALTDDIEENNRNLRRAGPYAGLINQKIREYIFSKPLNALPTLEELVNTSII